VKLPVLLGHLLPRYSLMVGYVWAEPEFVYQGSTRGAEGRAVIGVAILRMVIKNKATMNVHS